jgi:putative phosphoesterase
VADPRRLRPYLPPEVPPDRLAGAAGLVSDTHLPERLDALPPALFDALAGVDLVLHAGDVGELRVLDELSAVAPVVAVHGNDDTPESQRELPYQQVVTLAGQRIVLSHTHLPDRAAEMASRREDDWGPKLSRRAELGHRAGARVVVWGHAHIPLTGWHDGVFLVNPGALASPGYVTRQTRRTVALLFLRDDGTPAATHVDLAAPGRPFRPAVDLAAGFRAALAAVSETILAPDMTGPWEALSAAGRALDPEARAPLIEALLRAARPCWRGEREYLTRAGYLAELARGPALPPEARRLADGL